MESGCATSQCEKILFAKEKHTLAYARCHVHGAECYQETFIAIPQETRPRAFGSLPRDKAELHIYGPENQSMNYMAALMRASAGLNIRFHGTFLSERMTEVLAGLDVLVIPSRWHENSPLVLLNALATHPRLSFLMSRE